MKTKILLAVLLSSQVAMAGQGGSLIPPGKPAPTMKTLDEIFTATEAAKDPRTPISSLPFTISEPGSYYVTGNLVGQANAHGITIEASDVTLDLNGFTLSGGSNTFNGIHLDKEGENRVIRNGTVRGWSGVGVCARGELPCRVERIHSLENGGSGLYVTVGSFLRDCVSAKNKGNGVTIIGEEGSQDAVAPTDIESIRCNENQGYGFELRGAVRFRASLAVGNSGVGVSIVGEMGLQGPVDVAGVHSLQNGQDGFRLPPGSQIRDCLAENNIGVGVKVIGEDSSQGVVVPCGLHGVRSSKNGAEGILMGGRGVLRDCSVVGNFSHGVLAISSSIFDGNTIQQNGRGPNGGDGLRLTGTNNVVLGNMVGNNAGVNFNVPAGNEIGPVGSVSTSASPFSNLRLPEK